MVYDPPNLTFPFGAYVCVVDIDPEIAKVRVRRFVAVDDCGTRINPMIVEGQIHRGLTDGVGMALMELIAFDEEGNCLGASLMDYLIPTALEVPDWETDFTVTPSPHHPLGAKGVGESATVGSPPAIVNAICDALKPYGVRHVDMPCTPSRVWEAMQAAVRRNDAPVTGLVLAAGGSRRLGRASSCFGFGSGTLSGTCSIPRAAARSISCCALSAGAPMTSAASSSPGSRLSRTFGEGCSSSIAAAVGAVDPLSDVLVLMLGDQPGVSASTVSALLAGR